MKRAKEWLACSLVGALAATAFISAGTAGCGSSTSGGPGTDSGVDTATDVNTGDHQTKLDSGKDGNSLPDSPSGDVTTEAAGPFCLGADGGAGTQLLSITTAGLAGIQPLGLTADGNYFIYYGSVSADGGAGATSVYALPTAGGTPVTIYKDLPITMTSSGEIAISNNTVFVWTAVNTSTSVGTLSTIWNTGAPTSGTSVAGVTASAAGVAFASPDSTKIVYTSGVNTTTGATGNLVGAAAATPTTTTTLLTSTAVGAGASTSPSFLPDFAFVSNDYFVAAHQESGSATITVSSFSTSSWAKVDLLTGALPYNTTLPIPAFTTDTAGDYVVSLTSGGQLEIIPVAGPALLAQNVGTATTTDWQFYANGDGIIFTDSSKNLWTATVTAGIPGTPAIVTNPAGGLYTVFGPIGLSPDDSEILFYQNFSSSTDGTDLYVVPNAATSTAHTLLSSTTGAVFGNVFTADSKYALYVTGLVSAGPMVNGSIGQLQAFDVASATVVNVTTKPNVWDSNAISGSVILYNDNFQTGSMSATEGVADLKTVDLSVTPLAPTLIHAFADQNYYLPTSNAFVIYTLTLACDTSLAGVYSYTFP
jgi:hypothetical protein